MVAWMKTRQKVTFGLAMIGGLGVLSLGVLLLLMFGHTDWNHPGIDWVSKCASPSSGGVCIPKDTPCPVDHLEGGTCDKLNKCCIPLYRNQT
jgi:hypothetical protein